MTRPLLALLTSLALVAPAGAQDMRSRANDAIHVLRAEQKPDGSYGGSVATTGLALYGFAKSGRQYREADGPFVSRAVEFLQGHAATDGSFTSPADKDAVRSTLAAALALHALDAKKYEKQVKSAADFASQKSGKKWVEGDPLEVFVETAAPGLLPLVPADPDEQKAAADAGKQPNGGYGDPAVTASRLVLFNRVASLAPPSKPEDRPLAPLPAWDPNAKVDVDETLRQSIRFLMSRQGPSGGFGSAITKGEDLGVTALAAQALWAWPGEMPADVRKAAERATEMVAAAAREDGSIHGSGLENYTTSAAVGALVASKDAKYKKTIDKARAYLSSLQADEAEGIKPDHWSYGGFGYGDEERPDLSNTQFAMDALHVAGAPPDDPAMRRALVFLQRCQNRSETNHIEISRDGVTAVAGNDGGAMYYPGNSKAGVDKLPDGRVVPRSYGSMTYALLKGFVFAGLPKDDARLKDAYAWCAKNYTLDRVPGYEEMAKAMPRAVHQGLFYYYVAMATALRAYGAKEIETPDGKKHDWRRELAARLKSMQKPDGSFVNENSPRWFEGDEVLATTHAVLALGATK
ncbi:MAG TPA: prenyltransferase/squalene oxidase repeat-containing protein [Planctomycetota bacterium]|nr:prenyltransferase/squalene oxidase repeat-containing protein [Planctomycetota bacterium]